MAGSLDKKISELDAIDSVTGATSWAMVKDGATVQGTATQFSTYLTDNGFINTGVPFTSADHSKLDGIEASADVTDATNVTAAGAVMTTGTQTVAGAKTFSAQATFSANADVVSQTTFSDLTVGAPSGNNASNVFTDETKTKRWLFQKNSDAESGSNAGSNFVIRRFSDAGSSLGDALKIMRSSGDVGIGETDPDYKLDINGAFGFTPGTSVTPVDNGDVVIEFTNNTTLTFKGKGTDGTVRSATLTLS